MGNNDSLPPPPPPGQPPHVPNTPPQPPSAPQFPPTQQMPGQYPPTQAFPQQGYPQQGYAPQQYAPAPQGGGKSKTPWIIGGAIVAAGAIVGGVLALGGGDDSKTAAPTTTVVAVTSTVAAPETTLPPEDTFVITTPEETEPPITELPPGDTIGGGTDGVVFVDDDTSTFSVALLDTFQTDTKPVDANGLQLPQVSGATDLAAYNNDHDTFGITVLVGPTDQLAAPADLLGVFDPGADVCTDRSTQSGYTTAQGSAEVMFLDGCGTGGSFGKIIMVVPLSGNQTIITLSQGPSPSTGDLLTFTQAVTETVTLL